MAEEERQQAEKELRMMQEVVAEDTADQMEEKIFSNLIEESINNLAQELSLVEMSVEQVYALMLVEVYSGQTQQVAE